mmetsp:Transcript_98029/g.282760  ORF Transcript_98029/g.282760 Transcript_98029/m.282760 type:complete len:209 (+) Transcript_98029:73-699(+)
MARLSAVLLASALTYVAGKRTAAGIVPAHLQPVDVAPQSVVAPAIVATDFRASMTSFDRPRAIDEGIRTALAATTVSADVGGVSAWESTFAIADLNGGQKLEGLWATEAGPDQWTFSFKFGSFGLLQCIAGYHGDSYMINDLGADFDANGKYQGVTSGAIVNSQGIDKASFSFQLDEKANPQVVNAQITFEDSGKVEKVSAIRPTRSD